MCEKNAENTQNAHFFIEKIQPETAENKESR
jgi:hypothetical protein